MKKVVLDLAALQVESFDTEAASRALGTVFGRGAADSPLASCVESCDDTVCVTCDTCREPCRTEVCDPTETCETRTQAIDAHVKVIG
ncbi:MAG TPA: hypothetical protein VFQ39_00875 [Longimicrobium sp.]|nr:hypothetical protein [Longimicrobium sp.]